VWIRILLTGYEMAVSGFLAMVLLLVLKGLLLVLRRAASRIRIPDPIARRPFLIVFCLGALAGPSVLQWVSAREYRYWSPDGAQTVTVRTCDAPGEIETLNIALLWRNESTGRVLARRRFQERDTFAKDGSCFRVEWNDQGLTHILMPETADCFKPDGAGGFVLERD
jgi:hypothetical protein